MPATERRRAALLVGVNRYDDPQIRNLECAEKDCIDLQGFLRYKAEFERVEFLNGPDATSDQILDTASRLTRELGSGDLFFFYFAGHGVEHAGHHWLLCSAAKFARLRHAQHHAVSIDMLRDETNLPGLDRAFVLDACRSDLLTTRGAAGQGMTGEHILRDVVLRSRSKVPQAPGSLTILCSCAEGRQAGELTDGQHGLFTQALLDELSESLEAGREVTLSDTFENSLSRRMQTLARRHEVVFEQRPWIQRSGPAPRLFESHNTPGTATKPIAAHTTSEPMPVAPKKETPPTHVTEKNGRSARAEEMPQTESERSAASEKQSSNNWQLTWPTGKSRIVTIAVVVFLTVAVLLSYALNRIYRSPARPTAGERRAAPEGLTFGKKHRDRVASENYVLHSRQGLRRLSITEKKSGRTAHLPSVLAPIDEVHCSDGDTFVVTLTTGGIIKVTIDGQEYSMVAEPPLIAVDDDGNEMAAVAAGGGFTVFQIPGTACLVFVHDASGTVGIGTSGSDVVTGVEYRDEVNSFIIRFRDAGESKREIASLMKPTYRLDWQSD